MACHIMVVDACICIYQSPADIARWRGSLFMHNFDMLICLKLIHYINMRASKQANTSIAQFVFFFLLVFFSLVSLYRVHDQQATRPIVSQKKEEETCKAAAIFEASISKAALKKCETIGRVAGEKKCATISLRPRPVGWSC